MKMRHVTINSAKLEESVKFYQEILGLSIQMEIRGKGPYDIVFLANGAGETCVEIIDNPELAYEGKGLSIGFAAADVEACREDLIAKGYQTSPIIAPNPATKFFFIKDPNGVNIQFINE